MPWELGLGGQRLSSLLRALCVLGLTRGTVSCQYCHLSHGDHGGSPTLHPSAHNSQALTMHQAVFWALQPWRWRNIPAYIPQTVSKEQAVVEPVRPRAGLLGTRRQRGRLGG